MIRLAALAFLATTAAALACPMPPDAIPLTANAGPAPVAYAQMEAPPLSAPFPIKIALCDPDQNAKTVAFDAVMPAHKHGMNYTVDVAETGTNRFEISNVVFHMPGLWELRVAVEIDGQSFDYTAEVEVK